MTEFVRVRHAWPMFEHEYADFNPGPGTLLVHGFPCTDFDPCHTAPFVEYTMRYEDAIAALLLGARMELLP